LIRKNGRGLWTQYEEALDKEDWRQAHDLFRGITLKIIENFKQREELLKKYKELTEKSGKVIKRYEGIIETYEKRRGY